MENLLKINNWGGGGGINGEGGGVEKRKYGYFK